MPGDGDGCSAAQRIAHACPKDGAYAKHGAYVSCVARAASECVELGLIDDTEKTAFVSAAAHRR
jgi:hypothetical protein